MKNDITRVARNDVMFAPYHISLGKAHIIGQNPYHLTSRARRGAANIIEQGVCKSKRLVGGDRGARTPDLTDVNRAL